MRNQSFFHTQEQYKNKTKTVTRRPGWKFAEVGDVVRGVLKCQGLKKGEKIKVLGYHRFTSLRWEPLRRMTDDLEYGKSEVIKEGFPEMEPAEFVTFFCKAMKCTPEMKVHRMEFEYIIFSFRSHFRDLAVGDMFIEYESKSNEVATKTKPFYKDGKSGEKWLFNAILDGGKPIFMVNQEFVLTGDHLHGCFWNEPLPDGSGYWGCDCGFTNWEIEHGRG